MVFNVNQARQLFVVKSIGTTRTNKGNLDVSAIANKKLYYTTADGSVMNAFLFNLHNIKKVKYIAATDASQNRKPKAVTITFNSDVNSGAPIVGEDYKINLEIRQAYNDSDENSYFKYGIAHASYNSSAASVMKALAQSLYLNQKREYAPFVEIYVGANKMTDANFNSITAANNITLVEAEQPYVRGTYAQTPVYFDVTLAPVTYLGENVYNWATKADATASQTPIPNTKKIADLEYFAMGERGDIYRNIGWPNVIPTEYMVDLSEATGYGIVEVEQEWHGDAEDIQHSPMTVTFVAPNSLAVAFKGFAQNLATAAGVTVEKVPVE